MALKDALPWLAAQTGHRATAGDVAALKSYLHINPNAATSYMRKYGQELPLHDAAHWQRGEHGVAVVTTLIAAYAQAVWKRDRSGLLPLHCAASSQRGEAGVTIVMALLAAYTQGAQEKDTSGQLPLHRAAQYQTGEHATAVVTALLTAYPDGGSVTDKSGKTPFQHAVSNANLPSSCKTLLREAGRRGTWKPPATDNGATTLASAYIVVNCPLVATDTSSPIISVPLEQLQVVARQARVLVDTMNSSDHTDPLAKLASAASMLAAEDRLSVYAAALLQAGPLLRELLVTAQAPHQPALVIDDLQALCSAAEEAVTHLRACHGVLMSIVSAEPPPASVDDTLIAARDAALAAAQTATCALSNALLETDVDALLAISATSKTKADKLSALLDRAREMTGVDPNADVRGVYAAHSKTAGAAVDGAGKDAAEPEHAATLETALADLDGYAADVAASLAQLAAIAPLTLASLGEQDSEPARNTLQTMRETTVALLWATGDESLNCYLTYDAPWHIVCSLLGARQAFLCSESTAVSGLVALSSQLSRETANWAVAFEKRDARVKALKTTQSALSKARKALLHAKADAEPTHDSDSSAEEDTASSTVTTTPARSEALRLAKHASSRASSARDAAAHELLAAAVAYHPETLVLQRKRLLPGGLPAVVSQRSRDDYEDIAPLERTGEGRHTLLRATFDGEPCVLKLVPMATGRSLVREASILKQASHPNIVKLHAVFVENDYAYLHLAYAARGDLEHFLTVEAERASATEAPIDDDANGSTVDGVSASGTASKTIATERRRVLPARQLQRLARQLCDAVAYLAERSIVHCDIKPANVFIAGKRNDDTLHAVLGDFDVSHTATGRTTTLTLAVAAVATHYTPGFAPPEVRHAPAGQPPRVSPTIDVYGLGCVIYAMHMHPRKLPEPTSRDDAVADNAALFSSDPLAHCATPAVAAWAASVPVELVQAATNAEPLGRSSARELLQMRYMAETTSGFTPADVQRPAYWLHQSYSGSWLEDEPEEVRVAVEELFNATAEPVTHGAGRDSHHAPFQRFKVTRVQRLEHPAVWSAYAAQRRHLADTLAAEGYVLPADIRPLDTEAASFTYPLEGSSLESAAGEVFLFHGPSKPQSIANSGFDVRYAYAGAGAGAMFGRGVYFAESASKADQYARREGSGPLTMVVARVLLGRSVKVTATRSSVPFLPEVVEKSTAAVPVYYDSIVADRRLQGMRFREIVVGEGSRAYPELFVEYERLA